MKKIILLLCIFIGISFSGCSSEMVHTEAEPPKLTVNAEVLQYKDMTYQQFKEQTGTDVEHYYSFFYYAQIPNTELNLVYGAMKFNEELAQNVMQDEDISYRVEGKLEAMLDGLSTEMSLEDFVNALACNQQMPEYEIKEGAGTAYYVGDLYAEIYFDSDGDATKDTLLQISLDQTEEVGPNSYTWLSWQSVD